MTIYAVSDWQDVYCSPLSLGYVEWSEYRNACEDGNIPSILKYSISPATGRACALQQVSIGALCYALGVTLVSDEL